MSSGNGFQRWAFFLFRVPELFTCFRHNNSHLTPKQQLLSEEDLLQTESLYVTEEGSVFRNWSAVAPSVYTTFVPSYGCSLWIAYRPTTSSSFPEGWSCDICEWFRLSILWIRSLSDSYPMASAAPSLRSLVPNDSKIRSRSIQIHSYSSSFFCVTCGGNTLLKLTNCSYVSISYAISSVFSV
jgi:hypothetical protein